LLLSRSRTTLLSYVICADTRLPLTVQTA
jgi:hypothetical protein